METQDVINATSQEIISAIVQINVRTKDASHVDDQTTLKRNDGREMTEGCLQGAVGTSHTSKT